MIRTRRTTQGIPQALEFLRFNTWVYIPLDNSLPDFTKAPSHLQGSIEDEWNSLSPEAQNEALATTAPTPGRPAPDWQSFQLLMLTDPDWLALVHVPDERQFWLATLTSLLTQVADKPETITQIALAWQTIQTIAGKPAGRETWRAYAVATNLPDEFVDII